MTNRKPPPTRPAGRAFMAGERVQHPTSGRVGTYLQLLDPDDALTVPSEHTSSGERRDDAALVSFDGGLPERVPYGQLFSA